MVFGSKSKSTRAAGTTAATPTPPAPARSRWLKGHHARNEEKHVGDLKACLFYYSSVALTNPTTLQGTLNDPNATATERGQAQTELQAMGRGREAHVPMSVRVKSMFRSNKGAHSTTART